MEKKEITKVENTKIPTEVNAGTWIPTEKDFADLDEMDCEFSLTTNYKTADDWASIKDQELCCFYLGLTEIPNDKGELVVCGKFITQQGPFISGQMILIESVKNLPVGTPLKIIYRGKKNNKSSNGATMLFDIKTNAAKVKAVIR